MQRVIGWAGLVAAAALWVFASTSVLAEKLTTTPAATEERLLGELKYLASDELEGRGVGTKGLETAAELIRDEFARAGLDVTATDGGAYQKFTVVTGSKLGEANHLTLLGPDDRRFELTMDEDYEVGSFGGSGSFKKPLVFCGYGIDSDEYDDFEGVELKDRVAVIMRRNPQQARKDGPFAAPHGGVSRHASLTTKLSNAFRRGAAAVLFVSEPYTTRVQLANMQENLAEAERKLVEISRNLTKADPNNVQALKKLKAEQVDTEKLIATLQERIKRFDADPLMDFGYGGNGQDSSIPVFHISQETCNELLQASVGKSLPEIEAAIDEDLKPQSRVLDGWQADGTASVERVRTEIKNVIGVLEGEGPHKDETIVVGAHYDHIGRGGPESAAVGSKEIHNGADDNASGTVALLELARRLGAREKPLPRRVVFIAFTGEETGLLGSAHYVKEPVFPLEETVAMYNMDMVGRLRDDELTIFGTGTAKEFDALIKNVAEDDGFKLTFKPEGFGPSDHSSFYGKKIPVLHLFTNSHRDYHRPSDDWDKVNVAGIRRVVDFLHDLIVETAAESRPQYVEVEQKAAPGRGGNRPYFGSIPDFAGEAKGYAISGVAPGSPAANGGLKADDVIVQLGEDKIGSLDDFDLALRQYEAGDQVKVVVQRGGKRVELKVVLAAPK
jgi:hypothetical protein